MMSPAAREGHGADCVHGLAAHLQQSYAFRLIHIHLAYAETLQPQMHPFHIGAPLFQMCNLTKGIAEQPAH